LIETKASTSLWVAEILFAFFFFVWQTETRSSRVVKWVAGMYDGRADRQHYESLAI
jgi:hypothetical protein